MRRPEILDMTESDLSDESYVPRLQDVVDLREYINYLEGRIMALNMELNLHGESFSGCE